MTHSHIQSLSFVGSYQLSIWSTVGCLRCARPLYSKRVSGRRRIGNSPITCSSSRESGSKGKASSSAEKKEAFENWREELELLFRPEFDGAARQILAQDLLKRTPEIFEDTFGDVLNKFGLGGITDVMRQVTRDILPEVAQNGPSYLSKIASNVSERALDPQSGSMPMPPTQIPETSEIMQEVRNVFNRIPEGVYTPDYKVLSKSEMYEIRKYESMVVAATPLGQRQNADAPVTTTGSELENAQNMGSSFSTLAGYLFGENEKSVALKMTTPVVLDKYEKAEESMSFIIGEYSNVDDVPKPKARLADRVALKQVDGAIYAALEFSGFATQGEMKRQRTKLLDALASDGVKLAPNADESFKCVIYNGPTTLPFRRQNEILIPVEFETRANENPGSLEVAETNQ